MKVRTGNNQDPTTLWKHLEEIIKTHIRPLLQDHGGGYCYSGNPQERRAGCSTRQLQGMPCRTNHD